MTGENVQEPCGRRIGDYTAIELLAETSHAWVHQGRDSSGRAVAIKELKPSAPPQIILSLYYQARQSMLLKHPGLLGSIEAAEGETGHFLVLQLAEGGTLWRRSALAGAMHPTEAVRIAVGLAQSLDCLHAAGIVHCALTPDHVLFSGAGEPTLTGLGHSQDALAEVDFPRGLDRHAWALAPEVKATSRSVTPATDVYSLGALLLFMLSGCMPTRSFDEGEDVVQRNLIASHPQASPAVIDALALVIRRCLARDPARRIATAWQFAGEACQAASVDLAQHWKAKPLADVAAATGDAQSRWYIMKRDARQQWRILRGTWRDITCLLLRGRLKGREMAAPTVDGVFRPLAEFAEFGPVLRLAGTSAS